MRHLPTRTTRRRVVGALATALLCTTGLTAPEALAAPASAEAPVSPALADGLALTPPMGFNNWNSTHCRAEFNETMVKGIADLFVEKGLKDAGYQYVNLDDCWALPSRNGDGKLVPDPVRFPNGIKAVADYVHAKGLKLGIYTSAGTKTCDSVGFPGALGHEYSDAQQFADWGVDYLKYDNCNNQGVDAKLRYTTMRDALKATGRPIVYSLCEWGQNKPWEWASDVGHLWRTTGDISDNWGSMLSILKQNLPLAPHAGPGHWNDPDMLEVGNGGMTDTEYRSHFSMWSVMAAPLLIGSDLRKASPATFDILDNKEVIAVDQDPLGKQGTVLSSEGGRWVVAKEMKDGSRTVALFNETGSAQHIATTTAAVGLLGRPRLHPARPVAAPELQHRRSRLRDRPRARHGPPPRLGRPPLGQEPARRRSGPGRKPVDGGGQAGLPDVGGDRPRPYARAARLGGAERPDGLEGRGRLTDHGGHGTHGTLPAYEVAGHPARGHGRGIVRPDAQGRVPLTERHTRRERAPAHGVGRRGSPFGRLLPRRPAVAVDDQWIRPG